MIDSWENTCRHAHTPLAPKAERTTISTQKKEIKRLEVELKRKDKALVEAAVLLVLQKKVQSLWEDPEDEK